MVSPTLDNNNTKNTTVFTNINCTNVLLGLLNSFRKSSNSPLIPKKNVFRCEPQYFININANSIPPI